MDTSELGGCTRVNFKLHQAGAQWSIKVQYNGRTLIFRDASSLLTPFFRLANMIVSMRTSPLKAAPSITSQGRVELSQRTTLMVKK